jgi:hypothetical protein
MFILILGWIVLIINAALLLWIHFLQLRTVKTLREAEGYRQEAERDAAAAREDRDECDLMLEQYKLQLLPHTGPRPHCPTCGRFTSPAREHACKLKGGANAH